MKKTKEEEIVENIQILCTEVAEQMSDIHLESPLGLANFMHILFSEYIVLDPNDSENPLRDIFILSNAHACVIQYVLGYLIGHVTLDDLRSFRGSQKKSLGGIEILTGSPGEGVAVSVGFAISITLLHRHCGPSLPHVYCVFGDSCYQEGVAQEAFSLCSKLGLPAITFIYDFNERTFDGRTYLSMNEDVVKRFGGLAITVVEAYGKDPKSIRAALSLYTENPKVIVLRTHISDADSLKWRCRMKCNSFFVSPALYECYQNAKKRMKEEISRRPPFILPRPPIRSPWYVTEYMSIEQPTRRHLADALDELVSPAPILAGCADATPFVLSKPKETKEFGEEEFLEAYIRYGSRCHGMCSIANGISAHGVFIPVCGTFLNSVTYGIPGIRLAAVNSLRLLIILSHDTVLIGEDGPAYLPVEALAMLRSIPNLIDFRPCDGRETRAALLLATSFSSPCAIVLTKQTVSEIKDTEVNITRDESGKITSHTACIERGAYFLVQVQNPHITILASGSEVSLAYAVRDVLGPDWRVSIVSFVSFALFEQQSEKYRKSILGKGSVKVSIEALSTMGWHRYADLVIGLEDFGRCGPGKAVYEDVGFTPDSIVARIKEHCRTPRKRKSRNV